MKHASSWRRNKTGLFNGYCIENGKRRRIRRNEYPELYRLYRILTQMEAKQAK